MTYRAAVVIAVASSASPAKADVCAEPDIIETFPHDRDQDVIATNVPTNAILTARYAPTAQYIDENVTLHGPDPGGLDITVGFKPDEACVSPTEPGSFCFNKNEGLLVLRPPADLEPGGRYTVEWPQLRGTSTASRGQGRKVTFEVGDGPDVQAPKFDGLVKAFWDLDRERDECTNAEQDRFYFDLTPGPVSDDFDTELLALRVFQTKGPTLGPKDREKIALVPFPQKGDSVRVKLSVTSATGDVCFAAQAEDMKRCLDASELAPGQDDPCLTKRSGGADKEVCVTTTAPPFFYSCAVAAPGSDAPSSVPGIRRAWPFALLLLLTARRRHRAHP